MSDRDDLIALQLANEQFIAGDGYPATRIHTNEMAAERLLASDWFARVNARAAEAEAAIAEAPHAEDCEISPWGNVCTCWKSRYRAGADHE